jgi:hypothetical protein
LNKTTRLIRQGIGHLTKDKIRHLSNARLPQMPLASGGFLLYDGTTEVENSFRLASTKKGEEKSNEKDMAAHRFGTHSAADRLCPASRNTNPN